MLRDFGVVKGDRVAIYLGMVPELPMALLACARLGAAHSVVFGGFWARSLAGRINDAECAVLITADGGWRKGGIVPLKQAADEAIADCPTWSTCSSCAAPSTRSLDQGRDPGTTTSCRPPTTGASPSG